jgi:hypothetical protein
MRKARRILKRLTLLFLALTVLSALLDATAVTVVLTWFLAPVAIGYVTLGILWYLNLHQDPKPHRMRDPYWQSPPRGGASR